MKNVVPKYSDFVKNKQLDGDKVQIDDIVDKPIIITDYIELESKFENRFCLKVQFYFKDDKSQTRKIFFTGSGVIRNQLQEIKSCLLAEKLPLIFETEIKNYKKYYSLV